MGGGGFEAVEGVREGGEELGVFGRGADADADGFGETHPAHRANDDTFLEEFVAEGLGMRADRNKEKIRFAGNGLEVELSELKEEAASLGAVHFSGTADVLGVIESGEGGGLADAGDIERSAELVHLGSKFGMADAVADAESSEAVDLRESTQGEDVVVFTEKLERARQIVALGIFVVGLVENNKDVAGDFFEEGGKLVVTERGAGGIVGIGDVDDTGFGSDGGSDGVEIKRKIAHGRLGEIGACGADRDGVQGEAAFAGDAVEAGAKENAGSEVDDFRRAEADEDFLKMDMIAGGKDFAEALAAAVGIPVGFAESATGGFHGFGRGAEGVFVGSEFDGVNLEFLLDLFDGPAGDVGGEALDVGRDEFFECVGHGGSVTS